MKRLEDLKNEILENNIGKFYVFYGEDYGIRKHYMEQINKKFNGKGKYVDNCEKIQTNTRSSSLFSSGKQLLFVYDDEEFANSKVKDISQFIDNLKDCTVILVYEEALSSSNLFKEFDQYITYFPAVQDKIAKEFIDNEVKLLSENAKELAYNCSNNYYTILLESDKIKAYSQQLCIADQSSYEALETKGQLLEKIDSFDVNIFMVDVLTNNKHNMAYWYQVAKNDVDKFFMSLTFIFNDFLIAALVLQLGSKQGGSVAYNNNLPWGRVKVIRDLELNADADYFFDTAYKVACIDEEIKTGKLSKDNIIDYFFSSVI